MGCDITKIMSGLYVGDFMDARSADKLRSLGITHILSIHGKTKGKIFDHIRYLVIDAEDKPYEDLRPFYSMCNDFIHSCRAAHGRVLIHCKSGRSRSVAIVLAYLMTVTPLDLDGALDLVETLRPKVKPNDGFLNQLAEFQAFGLINEKARLRLAHGAHALEMSDNAESLKLLAEVAY